VSGRRQSKTEELLNAMSGMGDSGTDGAGVNGMPGADSNDTGGRRNSATDVLGYGNTSRRKSVTGGDDMGSGLNGTGRRSSLLNTDTENALDGGNPGVDGANASSAPNGDAKPNGDSGSAPLNASGIPNTKENGPTSNNNTQNNSSSSASDSRNANTDDTPPTSSFLFSTTDGHDRSDENVRIWDWMTNCGALLLLHSRLQRERELVG
jgi:hypothetical protein